MDFELSPEHTALQESVRELMKKFPDEYWMEKDQKHEFPWEFYRTFAGAGYLGILIPPEYGGLGLGLTPAALVLEEVAASGAGMNGASAVHLSMFSITPVVKFGTPEMRRKYLPAIARGDLHVAFGITEPDAGTDTTAIRTTAVRQGDYYVIHGQKVWTSKALEAQKVLLLARTAPLNQCSRRTDGMTLFLADLDRSAVSIRPIPKMGRNAVDSNEVFLDGLRVSVSDVVGEEGKGFYYLLDGLNAERILIAHEMVGLGRAALRRAVNYARERVVFGRPIGQNQGIQFPLADALARLDAAELLARKAAWLYDRGLPCGREANTAKYLAAEAAFLAADRAVQTHGGFGYAVEYHVERYFREARMGRIAPISDNLVLAYLGQHVLGLPRSY